MNRRELDNETLAAFLDGATTPQERDAVLNDLASNPETYELFVEAAAIRSDLEGNEGRPSRQATGRSWLRRMRFAGPLLAAAGLAGVAFVLQQKSTSDIISFVQEARISSTTGSGSINLSLGAQWNETGWSAVRGAGVATSASGTAARLGARVAQLEFAIAASDPIAARDVQTQLVALLSSIDGAGPLAPRVNAIGANVPTERAGIERQIRTVSGAPAAFDVGAWLETARLAALSGNETFYAEESQAIVELQRIVSVLERDGTSTEWGLVVIELSVLLSPDTGSQAQRRAAVDSAIALVPR